MEALALGREAEAARRAIDEGHPQPRLHPRHGLGDGGFGEPHPLGREGEAAGLHGLDEGHDALQPGGGDHGTTRIGEYNSTMISVLVGSGEEQASIDWLLPHRRSRMPIAIPKTMTALGAEPLRSRQSGRREAAGAAAGTPRAAGQGGSRLPQLPRQADRRGDNAAGADLAPCAGVRCRGRGRRRGRRGPPLRPGRPGAEPFHHRLDRGAGAARSVASPATAPPMGRSMAAASAVRSPACWPNTYCCMSRAPSRPRQASATPRPRPWPSRR